MELELIGQHPEAGDAVSFIFRPDKSLSWIPGQYLDWEIPHDNPDSRGTHHWFTISAAPHEGHLMLTTRINPNGSSFKKALSALRPGDRITSGLPRGDFVIQDDNHHYVLIAGGIGITPFRSMLSQLNHDGINLRIDLLYLNNTDELVFGKELEEFQTKLTNFKLHKFIDRRIEKSDLEAFTQDSSSVFYLSGPKAMVESYQNLLETMVDPDRIKTDYFPGY